MKRFILKKTVGLEEFSIPQALDFERRTSGGQGQFHTDWPLWLFLNFWLLTVMKTLLHIWKVWIPLSQFPMRSSILCTRNWRCTMSPAGCQTCSQNLPQYRSGPAYVRLRWPLRLQNLFGRCWSTSPSDPVVTYCFLGRQPPVHRVQRCTDRKLCAANLDYTIWGHFSLLEPEQSALWSGFSDSARKRYFSGRG